MVCDVLGRPLAAVLGLEIAAEQVTDTVIAADAATDAVLVLTGWDADLRRARDITRRLRRSRRWWIGINGRTLRIVDAATAYSRRGVDVDLDGLRDDPQAAAALGALLARSHDGTLGTLAITVADSDAHRVAVTRSLETGVEQALVRLMNGFHAARRGRGVRAADEGLDDALTVIYRILFLLFAEARGLVPQWHPTYRRSYTIESLRTAVEAGGPPVGLWEALQAIARLAHRGCHAGTLRVTPFNGRLFAPAAAPLAQTVHLDDGTARDTLLALTTRPGTGRRERISYADLGVEQLGAVYERVLDYAPRSTADGITLQRTGARKATGTFYTPRAMSEYLVRRTLAPLTDRATAEEILHLRVLDPAMGSGAFLVAACRYLADAYERALVAEGTAAAADISPADRAGFRRSIAQRCLYGVDRNPTAVHLARLSLWLCTLAADRPLTFLDHHLLCGNSLIGAAPADVQRQPPARHARRHAALPLFSGGDVSDRLERTIAARRELADVPDDTAAIVRHKEAVARSLASPSGPLATWRSIADAWCAAWFVDQPLPAAVWGELAAVLARGTSSLPAATVERQLDSLRHIAARQRFFHWELEFPEVFADDRGLPAASPGFDAVVGNPPWDVLRGEDASATTSYARRSGCYAWQGDGHANLYHLFAERMLRLVRPGGRFGLLMPSGLASDHGSATLRQHLLEGCELDGLLAFDNRGAIFPIHRGIKFVLATGTRGGTTAELPVRFGLHDASALDDIPDRGDAPDTVRLPLTLVRQFSGDGLAIPEIDADRDRAIVACILERVPLLGTDEGWGVRFGRELNATDDKPHFGTTGLPVLEGKHLAPFVVRTNATDTFIAADRAAQLLGDRRFAHPRLGYREVAASTNRLTLIAAVIPAMTVTTHTVFCMKTRVPPAVQWFLCAVFNSYVANYLVRLRGATHVPAAAIHRLPVPMLSPADARVRRLAELAQRIAEGSAAEHAASIDGHEADLQARVADLYQLDAGMYEHILTTFPLVDERARRRALDAMSGIRDAV
jgi:hypothetical protein